VKYYSCACTLVSLNRCPTNLVVLEPGILRYREKESKSETGEMMIRDLNSGSVSNKLTSSRLTSLEYKSHVQEEWYLSRHV